MYRFLLQSSRSLLFFSPISRLMGSVFAGNFKARMRPSPQLLISSALMSSSSSPDSDSSGSKEGSSDSKEPKKPRKPEESSAAVPVVSLEASTESGLSSTGTTLKPMDIARAERIAYLEETTKNNHSDLRGLTKKMELLADKRQALLNKTEELTAKEERRLKVIEEEDLPDMRKDKERLVAEIAEFKKELSELRNAGTTDVKRSGIYLSIYQQQQQQQQQQQ